MPLKDGLKGMDVLRGEGKRRRWSRKNTAALKGASIIELAIER
jgi:hypothetical protein